MAGQAVRIEGLEQTQANLDAVVAVVEGTHRDTLQLGVLQLHRYMSKIVPVDTGRLKNSLHPFAEDVEAGIRTNVVYALPVEYRSHYVRRTVENEGPKVGLRIIQELQGEISDAFSP